MQGATKPLTERTIQKALFNKYKTHQFKFANIFFFVNESDFLTFSKSGYCYDLEVKKNRPDFFNDFKKLKHKLIINLLNGRKYAVYNRGTINGHSKIRYNYREKKYDRIYTVSGKSTISFESTHGVANRFSFVVPDGLVGPDEVPEYAGLIYVSRSGHTKEVKKAPLLHKKKHDLKQHFMKVYNHYECALRKILNN